MLKPSKSYLLLLIGLVCPIFSSQAFAVFVDGNGYYGLKGQTRTKPGFNAGSGYYQAIEQHFLLESELRVNDQSSFFLEFRLFDDPRQSYLGDQGRVVDCPKDINEPNSNIGNGTDCSKMPNDVIEPRYEPYTPKITKAYAQYATDYCLLTVGRRGRDWGLGMFLDSGTDVFDTDASVYDGVTCDVNLQKTQTLSFSLGYDKITETGRSVFLQGGNASFGANHKADDVDQLFLTIEYNDHKANAGQAFSQQIGIYFANILGGKNTQTDIKLADLYLNFVIGDLVLQQEILFRLGKTADPNIVRLGGVRSAAASTSDDDANRLKNDVQSIAAAGNLEYFLSRSGTLLGPERYKQGTAKSHSLFLSYAYAPGDADGYYPVYPLDDLTAVSPRNDQATAIAFHRNFKPALLLFNSPPQIDSYRIDGVFDPYRLMNTTVFSLGYRYRSLENGNFEAKLITAKLNEGIPSDVKASFVDSKTRPIGYDGTNLGWELDLIYNKTLGQSLLIGGALAVGLPGKAWNIDASESAEPNYLIEGNIIFKF